MSNTENTRTRLNRSLKKPKDVFQWVSEANLEFKPHLIKYNHIGFHLAKTLIVKAEFN
jgi:hypothetical protein